MKQRPYLSIIIPAHNEAHRLPQSLTKIVDFLQQQDYTAEVWVIENGSQDNTAEVVKEFQKRHTFIKLHQSRERGKGLAIKIGMQLATGEYRYMCDADLSTPIEELQHFLDPRLKDYDVIIGSREAKGAQRIGEPLLRHLLGRVANMIIQVLAVAEYADTQCGFKLFKGHVADRIFGIQRLNGIGFDVEIIYLAQKYQYSIYEMPVLWYYDPDTRIRLFKDSLAMIGELTQIRRDWERGLYSPTQSLSEIHLNR